MEAFLVPSLSSLKLRATLSTDSDQTVGSLAGFSAPVNQPTSVQPPLCSTTKKAFLSPLSFTGEVDDHV